MLFTRELPSGKHITMGNQHFSWVYQLEMSIFNSCVKLPKGKLLGHAVHPTRSQTVYLS